MQRSIVNCADNDYTQQTVDLKTMKAESKWKGMISHNGYTFDVKNVDSFGHCGSWRDRSKRAW